MHCGFMDSRLRRFPPDRASAVSYGQTVGNATRCPPLAHRSAAAHKLHSAQSNRYKIRESQNQIPGTGLSLFLPGDCPNDRDHRIAHSSYARWRTQLAHAARDAGAAPSPIGAGFVDAGVLAHRVTADTAERIDLRLELGHGIVLHVVRG